MKMKIQLMFAVMILMTSNELIAQETGSVKKTDKENQLTEATPEERAQKRTEKMKTELGLDASQESKIYAINLAHIVEMDKLKAEQKAIKEKIKAQQENTKSKIKDVLTPEQNVIFEQKVEENKKKQEDRRNNRD
jgi:periplasmic protein CpxP/Spy